MTYRCPENESYYPREIEQRVSNSHAKRSIGKNTNTVCFSRRLKISSNPTLLDWEMKSNGEINGHPSFLSRLAEEHRSIFARSTGARQTKRNTRRKWKSSDVIIGMECKIGHLWNCSQNWNERETNFHSLVRVWLKDVSIFHQVCISRTLS